MFCRTRRADTATKIPMKNGEGRLVGVLGIGRDITELKLAEAAFGESESRLRYALEGTDDGCGMCSLKPAKPI